MTTTTNSKPIDTLRDGNLRAAIWKNETEKGPFFSVRITRTWKDESGNYHDADTFSGTELLRLAHLAAKAYDRTAELRHLLGAPDAGNGDAQ